MAEAYQNLIQEKKFQLKTEELISANIMKLTSLFDSIESAENRETVENSILNELETLKENLKLRESILRV